MELISCRCGVVLDEEKLNFPDIYDHDTGELIEENAHLIRRQDRQEYVAITNCPVCNKIIEKKGICLEEERR